MVAFRAILWFLSFEFGSIEHMFDTLIGQIRKNETTDWSSDWRQPIADLTARMRRREAEISRLRSQQISDLRQLERLEVDLVSGARTMTDWVKAELDVSPQLARRMLRVARAHQADIETRMSSGEYGVDRADLLCRLRALDGSEEVIANSADYSLGFLYGMVDELRRIDTAREKYTAADRYLVIQPSLDDNGYRFWGFTPAADGQIVELALQRRADQLPTLPHQGAGQRRVDALVSICMDSLTGTSQDGQAVIVAEIFVDATLTAPSRGQKGARVSGGPRVGPNTLTEILCTGKVRVITQGKPIGASNLGETIPPAVRSYVLHRDQGRCVIDGCNSRYRLQPHHMVERYAGGAHDPDNLVTLCSLGHPG